MSLESEKQRILSNIRNYGTTNLNCIPCPFESFRNYWFGITKKRYYLVTAASKGAKTQTASFLFLYTPILYAFEHQESIDLHIRYFSMEEDVETIKDRFYSFLLRKFLKERVGTEDLECFYGKLSERYAHLLFETDPFKSVIEFFESHVEFIFDNNSESVHDNIIQFAEQYGTIKYNENDVMVGYTPNNPNTWLMTYHDHISMLETLPNQTLKSAIDSVDKTLVRTRNVCKMIHVVVQQQNTQSTGLEARTKGLIEPVQSGLSDSQNPGKSADITFGVVNPYGSEFPTYRGYKVYQDGGLFDHCRFIKVVLARKDVKVAGCYCNLFFDGRTCFFSELPPAVKATKAEKELLERIYKYVGTIIQTKPEVRNTLSDIESSECSLDTSNSTILTIFSKVVKRFTK